MSIFILIIMFIIGMASGALGTSVYYAVSDLSDGYMEYTYLIYNDTLSESIKEYTIWFEYGLYDHLSVTTPDTLTCWDELVLDPDDILVPDEGGYDALAVDINPGIAPGDWLSGFSVSFEWLGEGVPSGQFFDIIDPDKLAVLDSGDTEPMPEICGDGEDNDGNGLTDEEGALGCTLYYKDSDEDGWGIKEDSRCLCAPDEVNKYTAIYPGDPADDDAEVPGEALEITMELPTGWSMISLPVDPPDKKIKTLFPGAGAIFQFTTKYVLLDPNDPMEVGKGYWIYLYAAHTYTLMGIPIAFYTIPNAQSGWSMIGSCSYEAGPSASNGSIRAVFGFEDKYKLLGSGDDIDPLGVGRGFWINLSEQADLTVEIIY